MKPGIVSSSTARLADRLRTPLVVLSHLLRRESTSDRLTMSQSAVLGQLLASPRRVTHLAALEGTRPPSMTVLLSRMESRGWVRSEGVAGDRRVREYAITEAGKSELASAISDRNRLLASRLDRLSDAHLHALEAAVPALLELASVDEELLAALRKLNEPSA